MNCCIFQPSESQIEQCEEEICQGKKNQDNAQTARGLLQLYELYSKKGRIDEAISVLKEKIKYDSENEKVESLEQLLVICEQNSRSLQAGYASQQLALHFDKIDEHTQALEYYRRSSQAFEQCPKPPSHHIKNNHIHIAFLNFRAKNYVESARNFEKCAQELSPTPGNGQTCVKYLIFSFLSLCCSFDQILIEEVPLRFELIFGDIFDQFPDQKRFVALWSSGDRQIQALARIDEIYADDPDWRIVRARVCDVFLGPEERRLLSEDLHTALSAAP